MTNVEKYRKKPVEIEAVLLTENNPRNAAIWCDGQIAVDESENLVGIDIRTLEGTMRANVGDWIIKGVKGEFYPCKPDIFDVTYEPV
jgi:hypothetical protein